MDAPDPTPVPNTPPAAAIPAKIRYKIHWHVVFTHFPLSFFGAAFGFQILHLFTSPACLELATNFALTAGAISMAPTMWFGWNTWKHSYHRAWVHLFKIKIVNGFAILGLSSMLVGWRIFALGIFTEHPESFVHWVYLAGNTLLIVGAGIEGWYGGRLNHR